MTGKPTKPCQENHTKSVTNATTTTITTNWQHANYLRLNLVRKSPRKTNEVYIITLTLSLSLRLSLSLSLSLTLLSLSLSLSFYTRL